MLEAARTSTGGLRRTMLLVLYQEPGLSVVAQDFMNLFPSFQASTIVFLVVVPRHI